jgi:hypothetical protein
MSYSQRINQIDQELREIMEDSARCNPRLSRIFQDRAAAINVLSTSNSAEELCFAAQCFPLIHGEISPTQALSTTCQQNIDRYQLTDLIELLAQMHKGTGDQKSLAFFLSRSRVAKAKMLVSLLDAFKKVLWEPPDILSETHPMNIPLVLDEENSKECRDVLQRCETIFKKLFGDLRQEN